MDFIKTAKEKLDGGCCRGMKSLFILGFMTATLSLFGQTFPKTQMFKYKSEFTSSLYRNDFNSARVFLNDSMFVDSGLLCSCDTAEICSITFKKIESNWFVKANGDWQEFFSSADSLIKLVYFKNEKFILKPIGHSIEYNGMNLYGFIKEDLYVYSSEINTFWFDPQKGVVIVEGGEMLIRNDFVKNK